MNNPNFLARTLNLYSSPGLSKGYQNTSSLRLMLSYIESLEEKATLCREALFLTDCKVDRAEFISKYGRKVPGTCEWIRENDNYRTWLSGARDLLWISGDPGKGKTVLSIFLTEELERTIQGKDDTNLLFYLCSHQDERRDNAIAVLRSLVYQITVNRPNLITHVFPFFETPEKTRYTLSSLDALGSIFESLVRDRDIGKIFCVLDGLDECEKNGLESLVQKIADLFTTSQPLITEEPNAFKMVIVSRPLVGLQNCSQIMQIKLDPDNDAQVAGDVQRFISVKVESLSRIEGFNETFRTHVEGVLLERSEGTFLWVGFVMLELSQKSTCTEVLETLRNMPKGLPAIYERLLLQIQSEKRGICRAILQWITMSLRPLTLQELADAIGVEHSPLVPLEQAVRDTIAFCGQFLKIHRSTVSLVHTSAKDYLLRKEPDNDDVLEEFRIKPEETHLKLALVLLDYIKRLQYRSGGFSYCDPRIFPLCPLSEYAVIHWPEHARYCGELGTELFDPVNRFLENPILRDNWWREYSRSGIRTYWSDYNPPPLLHLACSWGIEPWVRTLLRKEVWASKVLRYHRIVNVKYQGKTALHAATLGCHQELVRLLLKWGANVNAKDTGRLIAWLDPTTALHQASQNGNQAIVQMLLNKGADIKAKSPTGATALHMAASEGHHAVVQLLLRWGADVNAKDIRLRTALHEAALSGYQAVIQSLLARRANVNATDAFGQTALHLSGSDGHSQLVQLLLEGGTDVNATDIWGSTALHVAALGGHQAAVQVLLDWEADVKATDKIGSTTLHEASRGSNKAVVQLLLEHEADPTATDVSGSTALHVAVAHDSRNQLVLKQGKDRYTGYWDRWPSSKMPRSDKQVVNILVNHGADINAQDAAKRTPLHHAVSGKYMAPVVELLLRCGANVDAEDGCGLTGLHEASFSGDVAVVCLLLDWGANPNTHDACGMYALHRASFKGHKKVVRLLLDRGANVNARDISGSTALHAAAGGSEVTRFWGDESDTEDFEISSLHISGFEAASRRRKTIVQMLLEAGADVHARDVSGLTALHQSAFRGYVEVVELLLNFGADANSQDMCGTSALHQAAFKGHREVVQLLLDRGANVDAKDERGSTALHMGTAGCSGIREGFLFEDTWTALIQILLDRGADVNAEDASGMTALQAATVGGHQAAKRLLLDRGAQVEGKGKFSWFRPTPRKNLTT